MSPESTYTAFSCNDNVVVFHQHGHGIPQALLIFRMPQRIALHEKKLIAFYYMEKEAATLLDDPAHDAATILNVVAQMLKNRSKTAWKRRMTALALVVGGALLASVVWYQTIGASTTVTSPATGITLSDAKAQVRSMHKALPETPLNTFSEAGVTESQNMQNIMDNSRSILPASPAEALQPSAPAAVVTAPAITPAATPVTTQTTSPAQPARQVMAEVLKRNADRGMFTIELSTGHERTLYAFLDPTCAVCRSMEPAIEQLAQQYNVVIFPVSVVNDGGNAVEKIVPLLCEKEPARRAAGWSALFRADEGMPVPGQKESQPVDPECATSAAAVVAVNDTGFRRFGFAGTPTVLTDTGLRLATGMLSEPAKIGQFLKITDPMTPDQVDRFVSSLSVQE